MKLVAQALGCSFHFPGLYQRAFEDFEFTSPRNNGYSTNVRVPVVQLLWVCGQNEKMLRLRDGGCPWANSIIDDDLVFSLRDSVRVAAFPLLHNYLSVENIVRGVGNFIKYLVSNHPYCWDLDKPITFDMGLTGFAVAFCFAHQVRYVSASMSENLVNPLPADLYRLAKSVARGSRKSYPESRPIRQGELTVLITQEATSMMENRIDLAEFLQQNLPNCTVAHAKIEAEFSEMINYTSFSVTQCGNDELQEALQVVAVADSGLREKLDMDGSALAYDEAGS
ncbi:uncharacterized protein BDZ99DRAFT_577310 [Mytilinidion resinicola]|uniref:Uncharacterized protein n=1 Tax=Mytilinidion resinicola TaxID=574789 RepID=A0A6A6XZ77_9PEZI|nr:uncharacterized protein BDZ99DRAFT_577310 [Mytilinidion resinicola]KAF2801861.1 hypothetical protein BDZ99DRAFT_577310 [Mytilinidion resinicola]